MRTLLLAGFVFVSLTGAYGQVKTTAPADVAVTANRATQLEAARLAFIKKDLAVAERQAEAAIKADPKDMVALLYLARITETKALTGEMSPAKAALARRAIALYEKVLARDAANVESYWAIHALYLRSGNQEAADDWKLRIAQHGSLPAEDRIRAYDSLIEQPPGCGKIVYHEGISDPIPASARSRARNPDPVARQADLNCTSKALEFAEAELILGHEQAWVVKMMLLNKLNALSGRAGRQTEAERYQQMAEAAQEKVKESLMTPRIEMHVETVYEDDETINRFLVSMPKAQEATVTRPIGVMGGAGRSGGNSYVEVQIDDDGFVISARSITAVDPMRDPAVAAARWARFDTKQMKERRGILAIQGSPRSGIGASSM